jgi:hypothetical protein
VFENRDDHCASSISAGAILFERSNLVGASPRACKNVIDSLDARLLAHHGERMIKEQEATVLMTAPTTNPGYAALDYAWQAAAANHAIGMLSRAR